MKTLMLTLIIITSIIRFNTADEMHFINPDYENHDNNLYQINNGIWKNNKKVGELNMSPSHGNTIKHKYYSPEKSVVKSSKSVVDKRLWKVLDNQIAKKRPIQSSWNNLQRAGWGKREGNWSNLKGLWGKRSSSFELVN